MRFFSLEFTRIGYCADFAAYGAAVIILPCYLLRAGPQAQRAEMLGLVLIGILAWTLIEYAMHRFVLHGLPPFRDWHDEHHRRPLALLGSPTILSATLYGLLIFLPAYLYGDQWSAGALTLGVIAGSLAFSVIHHATHHWRARNAWFKERKRWHVLHHHARGKQSGYFGVTTSFWDHVFGTTP